MKIFARAGLATLVALALSLAATAANAIEYDEVIKLTQQGVTDRTIVELIVKDGRAFDMNEDEIADLRDGDVSEDVIRAMLDPSKGRDWLDGNLSSDDDDDGVYDDDSNGYSTSLDRAYGQGYQDGRSTALVYSFGYYYGPLARYYYDDPFYYPFWFSGHYSASYWPSYYAFNYRPHYAWYSAYPYNYYNYDSYYCYTWYDPGYYSYRGYQVQPGYGRTIWDNGPRWRDGGLPPSGSGAGSGSGGTTRDGALTRFRDHVAGRPVAPPVIRQVAERVRGGSARDLVAGTRSRDTRVSRQVTTAPVTRDRVIRTLPVRRPVTERIVERSQRSQPSRDVVRRAPDRRDIDRQMVRRVLERPTTERRRNTEVGRGTDAPRRVERGQQDRQPPQQRSAPVRQYAPRQDSRSAHQLPIPQPEGQRAPEEQRQPEQRQPESPQPEARDTRPLMDRILPGRR